MPFDSNIPIVVASADEDHMDLIVMKDGDAYTTSWVSGGGGWSDAFLRIGGGFGATRLTAAPKSVWSLTYYEQSDILLLGIAPDGRVSGNTGHPRDPGVTGASLWETWWELPMGAFTQSTPITALRYGGTSPNQSIELYGVGKDGGVYSAWQLHTYDSWGQGLNGWSRIRELTFPQTTPLAGTVRDEENVDLFGVADDGHVYTAWRRAGAWAGWAPIGSQSFSKLTPVTALVRGAKFDLFAVGDHGQVCSAWYRPGADWAGWAPIGTGVFSQLTTVCATSRNDDVIDLFAIGEDGAAYTAWWRSDGWHDWKTFAGAPPSRLRSIGAVSRDDDLDLFGLADDGFVYTAWWRGSGWEGWRKLDFDITG